MKSFHLAVLTPRECAYEGEVISLVLKTFDGEIGFLAGREQTVVEILPGDFRFRDDQEREFRFETDGGVFEMKGSEGVLLCGAAYREDQAEQKKKEREEILTEEKKRQEQSLADYKMTRAALMRAFEKIKRSQRKN